MSDQDKITLFHCPQSRSTGVRVLLEELGAPYELQALNMKMGDQRKPDYLAINPMGKVPTIRHGDAIVSEQVAIYIYLADLFPKAGLAPGIEDPLRGPYLRWIAFYGSCFEPALVDHYLKREPGRQGMSPYGTFEAMMEALLTQLRAGPYILGDRYTAADVLWGTALGWTTGFGLIPKLPEIEDYLARVTSRPAFAKAAADDAALVAQFEKTAQPA